MTTNQLRSRDLRALLDFLEGLPGVPDAATLARRVMVSLPTLVPSDLTVWTEMDPGRGRFTWAHDVDHFEFSGASRIFARSMRRHPLAAHFRRTGDGRAFKLSDFLTLGELRRQPFYDDINRPLGCEHVMAFWVPGASLPVSAFALHRARRDFSERERLLLNIARAHVMEIGRTVAEVGRMREELAALRGELARPQDIASAATEPLGLSRREGETLAWVIEGKTNWEIGAILGISPRTVQTHLDRIYRKLGVETRAAAVACALTRSR